MKNIKNNSCLADFNNELENLNHSEMKELIGGDYGYVSGGGSGGVMTFTCVATPSTGNFGGYNSYSAFLSSYPSSPVAIGGSFSGGGGSSIPSTKATECVKAYDKSVETNNFVLRNGAIGGSVSFLGWPLAPTIYYGSLSANYMVNNYYSSLNLSSCLR